MKNSILLIVVILGISLGACREDEKPADSKRESLTKALKQELSLLSSYPLQWTDDELHFLDAMSGRTIVGVGEATHGTSEFFKAKHRIFKYMVENHGFKIFAIEADFGESIFINAAVLNSDKDQIESLMKNKMHFWTWRTTEVRDLLHWMCDYNLGKAEPEKVQYWGIDCQYNTYHPEMVKNMLNAADVSFMAFAEDVLNESKSASDNQFSDYTRSDFDSYLEQVGALTDSIMKYEEDIVGVLSTGQYELVLQLMEVVKQVSEVRFYYSEGNSRNYRDEYMAKNTEWLHEYFNGAKIVLWAHNFHVSDHAKAGSMGHYLKGSIQHDYESLGFLFSEGSFMAVTQEGDQYLGLNTQALNEYPKPGSINEIMYRTGDPVFAVTLADLQNHDEWRQTFQKGIDYFHIGAVYNNNPYAYYAKFDVNYFDRLIYFNETTASVQLE